MGKINIINELGVMFIALIVAYFIYRAYAYLGDLDSCACAPKPIVQNLKTIELYYLLIILGAIFFNVIYLIFNINYSELITKYKYLVGIIVLYVLSVFGVYIYYIYNVIDFKMQLNPACGCANQWQNNIIYLHVLYLSLPIILTLLSALFQFEVNTSVITLVIVGLVGIYYYEQYIINKGKTTESMQSMLGSYADMMHIPNMYTSNSTPFDFKDKAPSNPNYGNFSPSVAQPLQQFRQIKPNEYTVADNGFITTPLSSHEAIVLEYRK